jgi:hypothetical protein
MVEVSSIVVFEGKVSGWTVVDCPKGIEPFLNGFSFKSGAGREYDDKEFCFVRPRDTGWTA